jgi:hypothetical protein
MGSVAQVFDGLWRAPHTPLPFVNYNRRKFHSRKLRVSHDEFLWIPLKSPSEDGERGGRNRIPDACEQLRI